MTTTVLQPLPAELAPFDPIYVGAAARLPLGGTPLHQPIDLMVVANAEALKAAWPALESHSWAEGILSAGNWRIHPVESITDALIARAYPIDAIGLRADGSWIDPLGGLADLKAGRLRALDFERVKARPALLIQAIALTSELAIRLDDTLFAAIEENAGLVLRAERTSLQYALTRMLVGRRPAVGLRVLKRLGLLALVLPEVAALIDFHRSSRYHHKDVWQHTCQVVRQAVPRPDLRWAALLHDVGKVHTRSFAPKRKVHFFRHDELGALMCEGITARLRFPPELAEKIRLLVLYHLRANLYDPSWSDAAIRRFAKDIGPLVPDLLALSRADVTSKRVGRRREVIYNLYELRTRIADVKQQDKANKPRVPKGLGTHIIQRLGVTPGPQIGALRRACEQAVDDGRLQSGPDIDACIEFLRTHVSAA